MTGCAECERLTMAYETATASRMKAEGELNAAQDATAIKLAQGKVMAAIVMWHRAISALRQHYRGHEMTMGGGV